MEENKITTRGMYARDDQLAQSYRTLATDIQTLRDNIVRHRIDTSWTEQDRLDLKGIKEHLAEESLGSRRPCKRID